MIRENPASRGTETSAEDLVWWVGYLYSRHGVAQTPLRRSFLATPFLDGDTQVDEALSAPSRARPPLIRVRLRLRLRLRDRVRVSHPNAHQG